jgi:hypothetical protein
MTYRVDDSGKQSHIQKSISLILCVFVNTFLYSFQTQLVSVVDREANTTLYEDNNLICDVLEGCIGVAIASQNMK